jgi:anti-sigma factor RsiW
MTQPSEIDAIDELMAYADGRLDAEHAATVERRLAGEPEARRYVEDVRRQNEAVRRAYDVVSAEAVPMRLIAAVGAGKSSLRNRLLRAAPLAASLVIGVAAGWSLRGATGTLATAEADLRGRTLAAFDVYATDPKRPVEIAADGSGEMETWFANRLDMRFSLPKLADLGFHPIGGRLMIGSTGPAALLMYEDREGKRIALYVRNDMPTETKSEPAFSERDGVGVMYWTDGTRGFGVSARMGRDRLTAVAQLVKVQFDAR